MEQSVPRPGFAAPGLERLIDPGGYSAPALATAAARLVAAMANIQRARTAAEFPPGGQTLCSHPAAWASHANEDVNVTRTLELSRKLILQHQFEAALDALGVLPENAQIADVDRLLAQANEGLGRFTHAGEFYDAAARKSGYETDVFGAGYEFLLAGVPARAAEAFQSGLAKVPDSVVLLLGAGAADFLQGHTTQAVTAFLKAATLHPSDRHSFLFLGICLDFAGDQADHVGAVLKRHLEKSPNDAEAHELYAMALLHERPTNQEVDYSQVEALLKRAVTLDEGLTDAHFELGTLYAHGDRFEEAIREFQAALHLNPGLNEAHYRLASAYRRTGQAGTAAHEMELFRQGRVTGAAPEGGSGRDLTQFVSVLNTSGQDPAAAQPTCH